MIKKIAILFLVFFVSSEILAYPFITSPAKYYSGAIVGSLFGYGVGQAIQGRYLSDGLKFTIGEGISLAAIITGLILAWDSGQDVSDFKNLPISSLIPMVSGGVVMAIFRVFEIVDVWTGAEPMAYRAFKTTIHPSENILSSKMPIMPNRPVFMVDLFSFRF